MFELAFPYALLLFFLPFFLYLWYPAAKTVFGSALKLPFFSDLESMVKKVESGKYHFLPYALPLLIWCLLILALAGPQWVGDPLPQKREGFNIMLALDLSESMEIPDMSLNGNPVSRLALVKNAAESFVKKRASDKMGLILFGERAYLQTPFTFDRKNILMRIADATAGLAGKSTSIGDAIGLAVKQFEQVPSKDRILILLTDGANTSGNLKPLQAAQLAKEEGIKIYTIGLGANVDPMALSAGFMLASASTELDEETLKKIAELTGGQYFRATDMQSLETIYKTIDALEKVEQEGPVLRPIKEYYSWCLIPALALFIYWILERNGLLLCWRRFYG